MSFFQNTRKPEGFGGRLMITMMNCGHTPLAKWGFSHIQLKEDGEYLDIGCGGGKNISYMLARCPQGRVQGLDYSEVSVDKSRRLNRAAIQEKRCEVLQGDVMQLPYEEGQFDGITAFETIYFWPDLTQAFAQVYRTLKPGGTFLICCELSGRNEKDQKWTERIEGMKVYTAEQISTLLTGAGFINIQADESRQGWMCLTADK